MEFHKSAAPLRISFPHRTTATAPQIKESPVASMSRQSSRTQKTRFATILKGYERSSSLNSTPARTGNTKMSSIHGDNGAATVADIRLSMSKPSVSTINDDESAVGEPIVHDFAAMYIPKEFQPGRQPRSEAASMHLGNPHHSSDDEGEEEEMEGNLLLKGNDLPSRNSSTVAPITRQRLTSTSSLNTTTESHEKSLYADKSSYAESVKSYDTGASSIPTKDLPALQTKPIDEAARLSPLNEDDPSSFDLVAANDDAFRGYSLEKRSEQMFSQKHLEEIFSEPAWMLRFTSFLSKSRPQAIPLLIYYLDALKAIKAIDYANSIAQTLEPLEGHSFTDVPARPTLNTVLEEKAEAAFDALVREELPAWITHVFIQYVSVSIQRKITGTMPPHLRDTSEGLAEVFCLTDPSRPDNPIVFASEEFHRTTQYGVSYAIGRNCRFLQGPRTNPFSTARIRKAVAEQREHSECFLNYRRDGSPFMNLLMVAPLFDSRGNLRYFIGAQVDVSGLVKDCADLDALQSLVAKQDAIAAGEDEEKEEHKDTEKKDDLQALSEMLSSSELETVRRFGGNMHREHIEEPGETQPKHPRLLLKEPSPELAKASFDFQRMGGRLEGIYQNYLLVRPYPSLRILFASPALRIPGIMQSPFLSRIGGSTRVRDELTAALAAGRGVTAKIRWISSPVGPRYNSQNSETLNVYPVDAQEGRPRWIHCTPLLGHNGVVGVWMIVLVDEDGGDAGVLGGGSRRKQRVAPPVARDIKAEKARLASAAAAAGVHRPVSTGSLGDVDSAFGGPGTSGTASRARSKDRSSSVVAGGAVVKDGSGANAGAFAEWERKVAAGEGDGSLRSFGI